MKLNIKISLLFVLLFSLPSLFAQSRIINGDEVDYGDFPWMVSLSEPGYTPFCGGSLITPNWVLTAGHCVQNEKTGGVKSPNMIVVNYGDTHIFDTLDVKVKRVFRHENYDNSKLINDIALLELDAPIRNIKPLKLISKDKLFLDDIGVLATVAGWGSTKYNAEKDFSYAQSSDLLKVDIPIVSNETCQNSYGLDAINSKIICAGYQSGGYDSCKSDSGGPLITFDKERGEYNQIGIVSWGYGCARENYYGIYTRVSEYINWIEKIVPEFGKNDNNTEFENENSGNSPSTAHNIKPNSNFISSIKNDSDVDYFKIELFQSGELEVFSKGELDTTLFLYNSKIEYITSDDDKGENSNFKLNIELEAGIYYFKVSSYEGEYGEYELNVDFEPNNDECSEFITPFSEKPECNTIGTDKDSILLKFNAGWNLYSLPLNGAKLNIKHLPYVSKVLTYDNNSEKFIYPEYIESGKGYWLYSNMEQEIKVDMILINLTNNYISIDSLYSSSKEGWNLSGLPFKTQTFELFKLGANKIYTYNTLEDKFYINPSTIEMTEGFWLRK